MSVDSEGTILAPLIRPKSPASRYFAANPISIDQAPSILSPPSPPPPLPSLLNATLSETESVLTFFSNRLNTLITQTSETSSTSYTDSFIVEGRRLLACKEVKILPNYSSPTLLKRQIFSQISTLITSNATDSGMILVPSYTFSSDLTPLIRNVLAFLGYDSSDLLVEEFKDEERTLMRVIYEGSEVPWGKKVSVQRWKDIVNTIELE
ncbi:hypothetical protein TrST_g13415 [Triparma strigata]|uniref:Uncharacterized protein n=1 Tax=Triparma strigata TaxID=1606541 RepID=A0A9W7C255_9STRA|nr:hypothetical protein TrST_g13415 [Triparma strigata]